MHFLDKCVHQPQHPKHNPLCDRSSRSDAHVYRDNTKPSKTLLQIATRSGLEVHVALRYTAVNISRMRPKGLMLHVHLRVGGPRAEIGMSCEISSATASDGVFYRAIQKVKSALSPWSNSATEQTPLQPSRLYTHQQHKQIQPKILCAHTTRKHSITKTRRRKKKTTGTTFAVCREQSVIDVADMFPGNDHSQKMCCKLARKRTPEQHGMFKLVFAPSFPRDSL